VFTQSPVGLEFSLALLHWPPSLIRTHHLSRDPLVQIGHQDFVCCGPKVRPLLLSTPVTSPMCRRHRRVLYTQKVVQPVVPGRRGTRAR
jgi:hypothetical protein